MSFIIPPIEHLGPGHSLRFNRKSGSLALTPKSTLYKNPKQSFGSRVRRDTVRSAPGRAELVRTGPTGDDLSNPLTLANVPDGRFPCPHCNKTYLRAKHFKRHLLRRKFSQLRLVPVLNPCRQRRPALRVRALHKDLLAQ